MDTNANPSSGGAGIRTSLVVAGVLLALPLAGSLLARLGWAGAADVKARGVMVVMGAYLAVLGNTMPKRVVSFARLGPRAERMKSTLRIAGWLWVLVGLGMAAGWLALSPDRASQLTLVAVPAAIALTLLMLSGLFRRAPGA